MTRGEFYRCYRAGRPGWSRRRAVAWLWVRDGLALVVGIAVIFFCVYRWPA